MLPSIIIAAKRAYASYVTNLRILLSILPTLLRNCYNFHFIALRFASSFDVVSQADLSVYFHSPCWVLLGFIPTSNGCACSVHLNHGSHVHCAFMALVMIYFMLTPAV